MENFLKCKDFIELGKYEKLRKEINIHPELVLLEDEEGWTLLLWGTSYAYSKGNTDGKANIMLVDFGSDVNKTNKQGVTPLIYSIYYNDFQTAEYLLQQGANISHRKKNGDSALDYVMRMQIAKQILWFKLLFAYKDRFDQKDLALYHEHRFSILFS